MGTSKPTDPRIRITCEDCDGESSVTCSEDRDDGRGHYTVDATVDCETCDENGFINVVFDAETCSLEFYGDASFSEWGISDDDAEKTRQLSYCHEAEDTAKLEVWFAANAAHCAELAVDARKELCGKFATDVGALLEAAIDLTADAIREKLPTKRMAMVLALLKLAQRDIRADQSIEQTISSHTHLRNLSSSQSPGSTQGDGRALAISRE